MNCVICGEKHKHLYQRQPVCSVRCAVQIPLRSSAQDDITFTRSRAVLPPQTDIDTRLSDWTVEIEFNNLQRVEPFLHPIVNVLHHSEKGVLLRVGDRTIVAVHNTPFYDLLVVPPDTATVEEGIAWTFGKKESEYRPWMET